MITWPEVGGGNTGGLEQQLEQLLEQNDININIDSTPPEVTWGDKVLDHALEATVAILVALVVAYVTQHVWRKRRKKV